MAKTYLSKAGYAQLQAELEQLTKAKRELSVEIGRARELGDLRENAEYHAAREKLAHVLRRMQEIHVKLTDVTFIEDVPVKDGEVRIGARVKIQDEQTKEIESYTLVGPDEADPANGKLSVASPIGKALLGRKSQERVTIQLPRGPRTVTIVSLERVVG
ncbi:MAG: transcription elongation factor GreA [Candidatus Omnitrophica bacterium]|nr:transcription elongation factor GreA [Candidatus Omnitrophota bacterium]